MHFKNKIKTQTKEEHEERKQIGGKKRQKKKKEKRKQEEEKETTTKSTEGPRRRVRRREKAQIKLQIKRTINSMGACLWLRHCNAHDVISGTCSLSYSVSKVNGQRVVVVRRGK